MAIFMPVMIGSLATMTAARTATTAAAASTVLRNTRSPNPQSLAVLNGVDEFDYERELVRIEHPDDPSQYVIISRKKHTGR